MSCFCRLTARAISGVSFTVQYGQPQVLLCITGQLSFSGEAICYSERGAISGNVICYCVMWAVPGGVSYYCAIS